MAAKQTFPLQGYERFFAMTPQAAAKLAFVMTVRGDISTLIANLPKAILQTFNKYPRMRTVLLPGIVPQKAMVCPQLVDVAELTDKIYSLVWRDKEEESSDWESFVQRECEKPIDRVQDWPYTFHVFADKTTQRFARIVLLADHYMADATSGAIVLNALLQNAAAVSSSPSSSDLTVQEKPLTPSLYECMHNTSSWMGVFNEAVSKWVIEPIFHFDHAGFVPALPVDTATQRDFAGKTPEPVNPSRALFKEGTASNMQRALLRCQQEHVSLESATVAAVMLAIGLAQHNGNLRNACSQKITMKTDVHFDLREKYASKVGPGAVGMYSTAGNLVFTGSEGAAVTDAFWDLARQIDDERRETREGHELKLQSTYVHETLNAENAESSLQVKNCVHSDVTLSSAGIYTHPHEIPLRKADEAITTTLHVESLHVYNSLPSLSSACMIFLSGVSSFNYSMMEKLEGDTASKLFHWFVQTMETLGEIAEGDSLLVVSEKLERRESGGHDVEATTPSKEVSV